MDEQISTLIHRIEKDLKDKATLKAKQDGRSLSSWVRMLIKREVSNDTN